MEYDLHVHSKYSFDSTNEPKKIIEVAKKVGLHGVAICDHNSVEGGLEALGYADDDFIVIPGIEVGTTEGDIVGLFVTEMIDTVDPFEMIEAVKAQEGLVILPHPFRRRPVVDERLLEKIDAIEGYNSRGAKVRKIFNSHGEEDVVKVSKRFDLPTVAGSDAHFYREIGRARTIIPASTANEVKREILRGNTVLSGRRSSVTLQFLSFLLKVFNLKLRR